MSLTATIVTAILRLMPAPSPAWGEPPPVYRERVELIAEAIAAASDGRRQRAMAIVVVFWGESRFAPLIHSGERRGDGGKAICMGQVHQLSRTVGEWEGLAGTSLEATTRCARATGDALVRAWWYCRALDGHADYPEAFVLYGTGRTCRASETRWAGIFRDRGTKWAELAKREAHN